MGLYLLDYGAGNVQSLANTLKALGHDFQWISSPADFEKATVSFFHPAAIFVPLTSHSALLLRASSSPGSVHLAAPLMASYHAVSTSPCANTLRRGNHTSASA